MSSTGIILVSEKEKEDKAQPTIKDIIDKIDCFQKDFTGFKAYLLQYIDEAIERALKDRRKRKPYVEVGYRG